MRFMLGYRGNRSFGDPSPDQARKFGEAVTPDACILHAQLEGMRWKGWLRGCHRRAGLRVHPDKRNPVGHELAIHVHDWSRWQMQLDAAKAPTCKGRRLCHAPRKPIR